MSPVGAQNRLLDMGAEIFRHNTLWTPAEDATLIARWPTKELVKLIAYDMGRTEKAVTRRAKFLGLPKRNQPWLDDDDAILKLLWAGGYLRRDIALTMGRTEAAICSRARVLGLERRSGGMVLTPGSYRWRKKHGVSKSAFSMDAAA